MVSPKKVRRLMSEDNLVAVRRRKFVVTTDSGHRFRVHPNLAQYLELTDIDQLWVADLTYRSRGAHMCEHLDSRAFIQVSFRSGCFN